MNPKKNHAFLKGERIAAIPGKHNKMSCAMAIGIFNHKHGSGDWHGKKLSSSRNHREILKILQLSLIFLIGGALLVSSQETKPTIYLIPGLGSDYRLFGNLDLRGVYETRYINHVIPDRGMSMQDYANELSNQIDTLKPYVLVGVSLGGMLAVEMSDFLKPETVIVISSAKCRNELPHRYRFQRIIPVYKLVSGKLSKKGALFLQPIVEPDRGYAEETFQAMLEDKDPEFMKRSIAMIMEWDRENYTDRVFHIHGDHDRTIPIRNVKYDYLVEDGSHMMVLTLGSEISGIVLDILGDN